MILLSQRLILMLSLMLLVSCATNPISKRIPVSTVDKTPTSQTPTEINGPLIGISSMDPEDKNKMSHALDQGLGKSTTWSNPKTGIDYSVIPVAKITYQNNPFCRKYSLTVSKASSSRIINGTACVNASDASWRVVQ